MSELHGTKETKEAAVALLKIGAFVVKQAKDGVSVGDAVALFAKLQDPAFMAIVAAGADGIDKVPAEFKDMNLSEAFQLAGDLLPEIIKAIEESK